MTRPETADIVFFLALALAAPLAADDHLDRMEREHRSDHPAPTPAAEAAPAAAVDERVVVYAEIEGTAVRGHLALPAGAAPRGGILLIHEWWGLNDNIRAVAGRFAGEGYAALAVDLYEGEVAADRETAGRLARGSMEKVPRLEENLRQAAAFLRDEAGIDRLGVVGWCYGGGWSLRAGLLLGDGVDAVVMYYGRVITESGELEALSAPLLGHFGSLDQGIPVEEVRAMESALAAAGKEATVHVYDGADHAFANSSGTRYDEAAAELAWERTLAFFGRLLR